MAAPTVSTTGTFGAKATLASSALTSVAASIKVTGLNVGGNFDKSDFVTGENTKIGALASGGVKTLSIEFIYAGSDCPEPAPLEVVTVSAASDARANGKWMFAAMIDRGASQGQFMKYSLKLEQYLDTDCVTVLVPSQS